VAFLALSIQDGGVISSVNGTGDDLQIVIRFMGQRIGNGFGADP
jgi:hypothetical protein